MLAADLGWSGANGEDYRLAPGRAETSAIADRTGLSGPHPERGLG